MRERTPILATLYLSVNILLAQHPHPQPKPGFSTTTLSPDGTTTIVVTKPGPLPSAPCGPEIEFSCKNFLQTVNSNLFDSKGNEIPNTNPSTPTTPYNLMDGPVVVTPLASISSPQDDLLASFNSVIATAQNQQIVDHKTIQFALDILEGNPIPSRPTYSGLPVLHYVQTEKVAAVQPIFDANGVKIGGNVNVHQIWFDQHIEGDTCLLDVSQVQDVPWEITYTVDVLHKGADDFAALVMLFDAPTSATAPPGSGGPNASMDLTFFPMQEGTRNVMKIKMAPGKYFNLQYHWGWRKHPPRVQIIENVNKVYAGQTLYQWESGVFGVAPRSSRQAQLAAIAMIGALAPEKIMWQDLMTAQQSSDPKQVMQLINDALLSFNDYIDRTHLPRGFTVDPTTDVTLVYANNTIYGSALDFNKWTLRPQVYNVTLVNADNFRHDYLQPDFGGQRGWENQFQSTRGQLPNPDALGAGCEFTFGRFYWNFNAGGPPGPIHVDPAAADGTPTTHKVSITLNFEPNARVRLYQFDPAHHDVAVYTLH
jgi:hypothetical protein